LRSPRPCLATACFAVAALFALCLGTGPAAAEPALPPGFQDEVVFDGLEQPTNFRFAADGRVFVAEKPGVIKVYDDLGDTEPDVFADLRGDVYSTGDRGLLGLALDPEFENGRPFVYALYTWDHVLGKAWDPLDPEYGKPGDSNDPQCPSQNSSKSCLVSGRLVRLTENSLDPNHAIEEGGLPKQEELLQGWCQQFDSHSIGDLQFGPEGALYVSGGDGAAYESIPDYGQLGTPPNPCGDPPSPAGTAPAPGEKPNAQGGALRSQNLKLLNGAILRVDPDSGDAFSGNPLAASADANTRRTVAKGFRNPFRFVLDPQSGTIYTGNVGSSEIEEIDRIPAPPSALFNSGWPCFEGIERQYQFKELGLNTCSAMYAAEPDSASLPFFSYSHGQSVVPEDECPIESGSAVSGISLYRGSQLPPAYKGALFFADAVRGCIWVMYPGEDGVPDPSTTERFLREGRVYAGVEVAEGPGGYLYYANLFSEEGSGEGEIHRIAYRPNAPTARLSADPPYGLYDGGGDFEASLDAGGSTDPNGQPLTYEWDLDEDGEFEFSGLNDEKTVVFTSAEQAAREAADPELSPNRIVTLRVKDNEGLTSVARLTLYPGDKPPVPVIDQPSSSYKWSVGDEIDLHANATDSKGNPITSPLPYYWVTRMAHCPDPAHPSACHVHPLQTFAGIRGPEFVAPQHDYPSYIEVVLSVADGRGLAGVTTLKIQPQTVNLSLSSDPPGVKLLAGSTSGAAPFIAPVIDGSEILISAPATAQIGGRTYAWQGWSDGGARFHPVLADEDASYEALYSALPVDEPPIQGDGKKPAKADNLAPQTKLGRHPAKRTRKRSATFAFSADEPGVKFRCKLDKRAYVACRSPWVKSRLKPGGHLVKIAAVDAAGNQDPSPATFAWKVLKKPKAR
jgi:glucose/arabinose dehydrogenase